MDFIRPTSVKISLFVVVICCLGFLLSENVQENENHCNNYTLSDGRRTCYFHLNPRAVNRESAWQHCNQRNSTLPVIRSREEQEKLLDYLKFYRIRLAVWTSGKRNTTYGWKWINGKPLERNISGMNDQNKTHGALNESYGYKAQYASPYAYYICQYHGDTCKSTDYLNLTNGCVHKHLSVEKYAGWYTARNRCLEKRGDLAILEDRDIETMRTHLPNPKRGSHWIGLVQYSWFWNKAGNPEIKFTNWDYNEPYSSSPYDCILFIANSGYWRAIDCNGTHNHYIVCQRDMSETTLFTPSLSDFVSNDPSSTRTVSERNSTEAMVNGIEKIKNWIIIGAAVAVAVLIFVVIFILVRIIRKTPSADVNASKKSNNRPRQGYEIPNIKDRQTESAADTMDAVHTVYAVIPQATKSGNTQNEHAGPVQPEILYTSVDFQSKSPTYAEPAFKSATSATQHAPDVTPMGDLYAEVSHQSAGNSNRSTATGLGSTKLGPQGDIYALPSSSTLSGPPPDQYSNLG